MLPATITIQRVRDVSEKQIESAAALFYSLMANDIGARCLCGGDSSKLNALTRAMLRAGSLAGEYYEAVHESDGTVGYLMTMPPGQDLFNTEEQRALGLNEFMAGLSEEGKQYYKTTYLTEFPAFVNGCLGPTGKTDSWYIHTIMVRREYQRQGVATGLLDTIRTKALAAGDTIAMSTTTDLNAEIYQKMGMIIKGKKEMLSPWGTYPLYILSNRDEHQE